MFGSLTSNRFDGYRPHPVKKSASVGARDRSVPAGDKALLAVADGARSMVAGCTAAAVTVVRHDEPVLLVATSLRGRQLERAQWTAGHGPSIDAIRQLQVFNVASLAATASWPEFASVALARGVHSVLALPVTARGGALGVLALYGGDPGAFDGHEADGLRYATGAAAVLAEVRAALDAAQADGGALDGPGSSRAVS